ncbi:MAG: hypothetical protein US89_C0002G0062 [Candidatus Peregrinibacteria bacterium GW2011_GWF2_38_29]|nr:MAG: hypothetical protein US89_C0002G0062 [Candidatus Peregrinibacteria bacterium GW2011_GWF2_38_29]HBB02218.1 hypothetical protein [Candidatus Peregrinibacteria bacterium]
MADTNSLKPKNHDEEEVARLARTISKLVARGEVDPAFLDATLKSIGNVTHTAVVHADPAAFEEAIEPAVPFESVVGHSGATVDDDAPVDDAAADSGAEPLIELVVDASADAPIAPPDVAEPSVEAVEAPESGLTEVPFDELYYFLLERGTNLREQLDSHVDFMVRMGIVPKKDVKKYRAKFDTISVDLPKFKFDIRFKNRGYRPLLFIDDSTPAEAAKKFIQDIGIRYNDRRSPIEGFHRTDLNGEKLPDQTPSGKARLIFVKDSISSRLNDDGSFADDVEAFLMLKKMRDEGTTYMDPACWFRLFAEYFEKAVKRCKGTLPDGKEWKDLSVSEKSDIMLTANIVMDLLDSRSATQFPDYRDKSGDVLVLFGNDQICEVHVAGHGFYTGENGVAPRKRIG